MDDTSPRYDLAELRRRIAVGFSTSELAKFAEPLSVHLDREGSVDHAARALIKAMQAREAVPALVERLRAHKPLVEWPDPLPPAPDPNEAYAPKGPWPASLGDPPPQPSPAGGGGGPDAGPSPSDPSPSRSDSTDSSSPRSAASDLDPGPDRDLDLERDLDPDPARDRDLASSLADAPSSAPAPSPAVAPDPVPPFAPVGELILDPLQDPNAPPESSRGFPVRLVAGGALAAGVALGVFLTWIALRKSAAADPPVPLARFAAEQLNDSVSGVIRACGGDDSGGSARDRLRAAFDHCAPTPAGAALVIPDQTVAPTPPSPPPLNLGPSPPLPAGDSCLLNCNGAHHACLTGGCGPEPTEPSQFEAWQRCQNKCVVANNRCRLACR